MKVRILCEIVADVVDKEEVEAIKDTINKDKSFNVLVYLWRKILEKSLKNICPSPVYENKTINLKVDYFDKEKEKQEFQLGDTAYMIDEDYNLFESEVYIIAFKNGKYLYDTRDIDFEHKDIGIWVFKSIEEREMYLEMKFID